MIYADHAATTPPREEAVEMMTAYLNEGFHNPSASYAEETTEAVADARAQVADLLGADADEIIFTSGGTEADNLALKGVLDGFDGGHVVTSTIEHSAITKSCAWLEERGVEVSRVSPNEDGRVNPNAVRQAIRSDTDLVSVMHANNVTGVIQPIKEIGEIASEHDAFFHSDTVQSAGKIPIDVDGYGLEMASLSAHKLYGPKGVGALYVRDGVRSELEPLLHGGGQEFGVRSGTENAPGIAGFGRAAELVNEEVEGEAERRAELRRRLISQVGMEPVGHSSERLPGYALFCFEGQDGTRIVDELTERGIAVSSGSACHSGQPSPSHVLLEMGMDPNTAIGAVRVSLGRESTRQDVDKIAEGLNEVTE